MQVEAKGLTRRSAESGDDIYDSYQEVVTNLVTGAISNGSSGSYLKSSDKSYMVGWDNPNFHARVRKGELLPQTPWTQFTKYGKTRGHHVHVQPGASGANEFRTDNWSFSDSWNIQESELAAYVPATYDKYVTDAAAKIYSNGYDVLTALAELVEVRRMFFQTGKTLVTLLSEPRLQSALFKFARLSTKRKASFLIKDLLAGHYLQYRYGWRTLIFDLMAINDTVDNWNESRTRFSESVGSDTASQDVSTSVWSTFAYICDSVLTNRYTVGIRGSVIADIDIPKLQANIFATAWELVPLSFVVDWFVTVGKSINAMSFLVKQSKYTASAGFKVECERSYELKLRTVQGPTLTADIYQLGRCHASYVVRRPCAVPITPHFTLNLDSFKVLDLLSLIGQRIGGK